MLDLEDFKKIILINASQMIEATKEYQSIEECLEYVPDCFLPCPNEFGLENCHDICGFYDGCCAKCWKLALK